MSQTSQIDNEKQIRWFAMGQRAKKLGWSRTSTIYSNATGDYFFYCGFDGVSFEEAQQVLKEKLAQILQSSPEIKEVLAEQTSSAS